MTFLYTEPIVEPIVAAVFVSVWVSWLKGLNAGIRELTECFPWNIKSLQTVTKIKKGVFRALRVKPLVSATSVPGRAQTLLERGYSFLGAA